MNQIPLNVTLVGYGTFTLKLPTQKPVGELKAVMRQRIAQLENHEFEFYKKNILIRDDQTLGDVGMQPNDTLEIKMRPN